MLTITNEDNMVLMARYPDKYFDLAIVDPPYGIDSKISTTSGLNKGNKFAQLYNEKRWDKFRPETDYWDELLRVSKNQIVCGGNYFAEKLPVSRGWIVWDKQGENMSSVNNELMWTSFDISIKTFSRCHGLDKGFMAKGTDKVFHPTQKPVALYKWILDKYAKCSECGGSGEVASNTIDCDVQTCKKCKGNEPKILDTHLGSGSIAIACHDYGFDLTACELDKEYFDKAKQRINNHVAQQKLF
jgi:site-specific DNA-methyltransferase (adenine-specific)